MRSDTSHSQPSLLMLSDSFPDPDGGSRAARAWRLLSCAASTHQVSLSVSTDAAVNLNQWRRVAGLARRVHIESGRLRLFGPSSTHPVGYRWAQQRRFDALLVTSPRIWPTQSQVEAGVQLCDFADAGHRVLEQVSLLGRLAETVFRRTQVLKNVPQIIAECDHPLVATTGQVDELPAGQSRAVLISESGDMQPWSRMLQGVRLVSDFVTPEVTIVPVHPVPTRKAA
jgi:hypothetical protein